MRKIILIITILASFSLLAHSYTVDKISNTGDDGNRIVFIVMGDGYTSSQLTKFHTDADNLLTYYFTQSPWKEYKSAVNIYRVDVVSNQTGSDHPAGSPATYADTALDCTYNTSGIERLLACSYSKVTTIADETAAHDMVIVIVNDAEYGGSGGSIAVTSVNSGGDDVISHECGHTFGDLADEYEDAYPGYPDGDSEPNVSYAYSFNRSNIKWNMWIENSTPLPTSEGSGYSSKVGMFEGARYKTTGIYRPMETCKMRYLNVPFCSVCQEAQIVSLYNMIRPADSYTPGNSSTVSVASPVKFEIKVLQVSTIGVSWSLNGSPITGACTNFACSVTVNPGDLQAGSNTLTAELKDSTAKVKKDLSNLLTQTIQWTLSTEAVVTDSDIISADIDSALTDKDTITPDKDTLLADIDIILTDADTSIKDDDIIISADSDTQKQDGDITIADSDTVSDKDNIISNDQDVSVTDTIVAQDSDTSLEDSDTLITSDADTQKRSSGWDCGCQLVY